MFADIGQDRGVSLLQRRVLGEHITGEVKGALVESAAIDDKQIARVKALIQSMTVNERNNPDLLNASRKKRIAAGSGQTVQDVNRLLKQFDSMRQMMKQFTGKNGTRRMRMPFGMGMGMR